MIDKPVQRFGERLRAVRRRLGLKGREVEERTRQLAEQTAFPEFVITRSRLSTIENGRARAGVIKVLALASVYGLTTQQLVRFWTDEYGDQPDQDGNEDMESREDQA